MKKFTQLAAALLLSHTFAEAQSIQTLYYPNGKKRLEGACTYGLNPYFHTSLLTELFFNEGRRGRYDDDLENERAEDADYPVRLPERREQYAYLAGLSIVCDGPVTTFYRSGAKQSKLTFKNGLLTGPTITYYPEGGVAYSGAFEAGTPSGEQTRYYKDGSVYSKGSYTPFTQAELAEEWTYYTSGSEPDDSENARRGGLTEEGLRGDGEEASATVAQRDAFRRFTDGLMRAGRKEGPFIFLRRNGKKWAEVHYASDMRTGTWTIWNEHGKPSLKLEYSPVGRLAAITDSMGKRQTLEAFTQNWKETGTARHRSASQYGDPNGIDPGVIAEPPSVYSPAAPAELQIFTYVEQMPEFNGNLQDYLSKNLHYPAKAKKEGIEGRVVVQFVVREDGSITSATVTHGIGCGCDEEALRLVRGMPKWKPGKQNGKAVAVRFVLPVQFKLN